MRIKEEFKKSGYFWLPSAPEKQIFGTLIITDGGNIELEVIGLFDESTKGVAEIINGRSKLERIVGRIENGPVTLAGCFYKKGSLGNISQASLYVNKVFLGVAYDDKDPILFNTFKFSVEGIDEWVGLSGIKVENQFEKRPTVITYSSPEEVQLNLNNKMKLLITFSWFLLGSSNEKEAKITQKTFFKFVSEHERPVDDFISAAYKIATLLCFAMDKIVCIEQVSATLNTPHRNISNGETHPISISLYYASLPYTEDKQKIDQHGMLFSYGQIRDNAERIVNNWFDAYDEVAPALFLYFSTKIGRHKYLDDKFLALVQGLEIYHRRTSNEKLMEEDIFEKLTENLIKQCPEENQEWLSGKFQHGNEMSLSQRIRRIIDPFKTFLGTSKEREKLISSIVNTRNYLTHYDKSLESVAVVGKDLWLLYLKIEVIFQLHLLQILGFTREEIQLVLNSSEVQQKIGSRLHAKPQPDMQPTPPETPQPPPG